MSFSNELGAPLVECSSCNFGFGTGWSVAVRAGPTTTISITHPDVLVDPFHCRPVRHLGVQRGERFLLHVHAEHADRHDGSLEPRGIHRRPRESHCPAGTGEVLK